MANRLAAESSPYLRQHAGNPVAWLPWGEEAFARARTEDKPIFLSIGYSTCHWCHVMAHESFEDPAVAELLNRDFVPIKVDREERPDVDRVYMSYVQARTGHGGWPLSAWLTPELKPFFGGTYFPPQGHGGRPGFSDVLRAIAREWREDRARLVAEADRSLAELAAPLGTAEEAADASDDGLRRAAGEAFERGFDFFHRTFDPEDGGFGGAPKFPRASNLAFLFRCAAIQGPASEWGRVAVGMAAGTLEAMARGGIHDQVGGGFHRYAVDRGWFVPHFEKMLYDQAQIALNAAEAWQATGDERFAWLARGVLDYVRRDLAHPAGGFCAAEDADSLPPEGAPGAGPAEGAFYLWSPAEVAAALDPAAAALVVAHYGLRPEGNVPAALDSHAEFVGRNILAQVRPLADTAGSLGLTPEEASRRLAGALEALRRARERRPRPFRDDKIIAGWNGLAISALARASALPSEALRERRADYRAAAVRAADFARRELADGNGGLLFRSWREGRASARGLADDYAFFIQGLLDLYEATFDLRWLEWAERLQASMDRLFWDEAAGGYFNSPEGAADLVLRLKEDYDGAEPAASSVAALNLLRFDAFFGGNPAEAESAWRTRARRTLEAFRSRWLALPQALPQMLCALEPALNPLRRVALAGDPASAEFRALAEILNERLGPRHAVLALGSEADLSWWRARAPWLPGATPPARGAAAYVCGHGTCQPPAETPEALRAALEATSSPLPPL